MGAAAHARAPLPGTPGSLPRLRWRLAAGAGALEPGFSTTSPGGGGPRPSPGAPLTAEPGSQRPPAGLYTCHSCKLETPTPKPSDRASPPRHHHFFVPPQLTPEVSARPPCPLPPQTLSGQASPPELISSRPVPTSGCSSLVARNLAVLPPRWPHPAPRRDAHGAHAGVLPPRQLFWPPHENAADRAPDRIPGRPTPGRSLFPSPSRAASGPCSQVLRSKAEVMPSSYSSSAASLLHREIPWALPLEYLPNPSSLATSRLPPASRWAIAAASTRSHRVRPPPAPVLAADFSLGLTSLGPKADFFSMARRPPPPLRSLSLCRTLLSRESTVPTSGPLRRLFPLARTPFL